MSGYTKKMYLKDIKNIEKDFTIYVKKISSVLPKGYNLDSIIDLLEKYYKYEWQTLNEKYRYYCKKDRKLKALNKNVRYSMQCPKNIIRNLNITRKILSKPYKDNYNLSFNMEFLLKNEELLIKERLPKINKIKTKIDKAKLKAQEVEPEYIDKLIGLYERKNTTQKDRVYILKELEKYYCTKVIEFFRKKVDTEYNRQLREMAFYHLQGLGHFVTLRKQKYIRIPSKNKKRRKFLKEVYANQRFNIEAIPDELEYRIQNGSKEQRLKKYDFFISHSSADFKEVQNVIKRLNEAGKNVYCDWINDQDYLKRQLVGDATKSVIEKRLEQSEKVLFIKSDASLKSKWVKYELNYSYEMNKSMLELSKDSIRNSKYEYLSYDGLPLDKLWFYDEDYKEIDLFNSKLAV